MVKETLIDAIKKKFANLNVLVVGDWIVDEDWVMTVERSETSAIQVNEKHFHTAFEDPLVGTKRLCGAALTASAIRGFFIKHGCNANVYGIGVWHPDDDDYLNQLFDQDSIPGANPFRISRPAKKVGSKKNDRLFNLAQKDDICATTRIVRSFLGHPGTLPIPISRYDWHIKWTLKKGDLKKVIGQRLLAIFKNKLKEIKFDAIVLADFNKGLVSAELVKALEQIQGKGISWFYRSKQIEVPGWVEDFGKYLKQNGHSFLIFLDPRISKINAFGRQLTCGSEITSEGLEILESLSKRYEGLPDKKIAVLLNDNSSIVYEDIGRKLWILKSKEKDVYLTRGRSSIYLASLVITEMAQKRLGATEYKYSFGENCKRSLANGIQWCHDCLNIWNKGKPVLGVSADIKNAVHLPDESANIDCFGPKVISQIENAWKQAKNKEQACCITKEVDNELVLEVWRAHTTLNDYTVLSSERKETVLKLVNAITNFLELDEKSRQRPMISLIKAGPGSGKTFLAKCIARHFKLDLFECNIAQLGDMNELGHFLDQIDLAQREGRNAFVFIDEVNNTIKRESVFGYLLEMMWCGQYSRNGQKNLLKPFPGMIAMSKDPEAGNMVDFERIHPKYKDLRSRIYGLDCKLNDFSAEESIYLFAKLLDRYFGQIAFVEKGLLRMIGNTKLGYGPRSLEILISLLHGIKRNTITRENLPPLERISQLVEHFPSGIGAQTKKPYNDLQDTKLVKLVYIEPTE